MTQAIKYVRRWYRRPIARRMPNGWVMTQWADGQAVLATDRCERIVRSAGAIGMVRFAMAKIGMVA